jgi:hypothetical protein
MTPFNRSPEFTSLFSLVSCLLFSLPSIYLQVKGWQYFIYDGRQIVGGLYLICGVCVLLSCTLGLVFHLDPWSLLTGS